jgi:hypothetical protein
MPIAASTQKPNFTDPESATGQTTNAQQGWDIGSVSDRLIQTSNRRDLSRVAIEKAEPPHFLSAQKTQNAKTVERGLLRHARPSPSAGKQKRSGLPLPGPVGGDLQPSKASESDVKP